MGSLLIYPLIAITYLGVALGGFPRLQMNRATIALVGAVALIVAGIMPLEAALGALDANTLLLLFAMMVINVHLELAGFFQWIGASVIQHTHSPRVLLAWTMLAAAILSALFLNDTIVLIFTPLVLQVTLALRRNPMPYLLGLATAANIGSTATITGNPQNMLIGLTAHLSFVEFAAALAPVAILSLVVAWGILVVLYRAEFSQCSFEHTTPLAAQIDPLLMKKSMVLIGLLLVAFVMGVPIPLAAMGVAAAFLVTRRTDPERIFARVDWSLLVFFSGLFVVSGSLGHTGLANSLLGMARESTQAGVLPLSLVTALLSNLISNVPAVMLFRALIPYLADPHRMWLALAMSSTLAGNLTVLGSVANLIVVESARARGVRVSFGEYLRAGVPITLVTLAIGVVMLSW